jgi:hypothetical protein
LRICRRCRAARARGSHRIANDFFTLVVAGIHLPIFSARSELTKAILAREHIAWKRTGLGKSATRLTNSAQESLPGLRSQLMLAVGRSGLQRSISGYNASTIEKLAADDDEGLSVSSASSCLTR